MDISNIANLATTMSTTEFSSAIGIAVQKKAMDIQANNAAALIAALPPVAPPSLPPHLGQNVNTKA